MNLSSLSELPWPMMVIAPAQSPGELGAVRVTTSALRSLLEMSKIGFDSLENRFEVLSSAGKPIDRSVLPWHRAVRREEFEERQIWYDKELGHRLFLRVTSYFFENEIVLALEDESRQSLALEFADFVGTVGASLLRAEDPASVGHVIVEQVARVLKADAVFLSSAPRGAGYLQLISSIGLPEEYLSERISIPFDAALVTAAAARTKAVQQIPEIAKLPEEEFASTRKLLQIGMRSYVAVPLLASGELIGVIAIARRQPGYLIPIEMKILNAVAGACALGLQQARYRQAERESFARLQAVREATLALERAPRLHDLLHRLVVKACELTGARYGALGILNSDQSGLSDFITVGISDELVKKIGQFPSGKGLLGAVLKAKRAIRVAHIDQDSRSSGFPPHHPKMTSFLGVPIRIRYEIFGNFYLTDKEGGIPFTEEDERLLELFGMQAALVIDYARQIELVEEQRQRIDAILKSTPNGVIFDPISPGQGVIANAAAERFFGRAIGPERITDNPQLYGIQHRDFRSYAPQEMPSWRAFRGGTVVNEELQIARPDKQVIPVLMSASPVKSKSGEILGTVITIEDISQFKELERLREEFAAVIAHDLRNPIQTITMQVDLLMRQAKRQGELKEVSIPVSALDRIQRSGLSLAQMANDLLDTARIEFNRLAMDLRPIDPKEDLVSLIKHLAPGLSQHPINIDVEGILPLILVDPLRFDQILTNLIENAAKFSAEGLPIRVLLRGVEGGIVISVQDQGVGIDREEIPKLFDRFYQVRRAREKKVGLGLGLYIAKGLVEAHGGRIWVDSVLGHGSAFHVWLPAAETAKEAAKKAS